MVSPSGVYSSYLALIDKRTGREIAPITDDLESKYMDYLSKVGKFSSALANRKNDYLGEKLATQRRVLFSGNLLGEGTLDAKNPTPTMQMIQDIFGNKLGGKTSFNTVGGFDPATGWVEIQASDVKGGKPLSYNDLEKAAADSPYGANIFEKGNVRTFLCRFEN